VAPADEDAQNLALNQRKETSAAAAHLREKRKPRTKNREMAAHDSGPGNPSACFVEDEYGPGRTDGRRQKQNAWMDPSAQRGKDPARAGINTKNHTENEDFRSKKRTPRTPQTQIFSMEIQHGSYTAEVTALPPSF
jgi:hypothetical protein